MGDLMQWWSDVVHDASTGTPSDYERDTMGAAQYAGMKRAGATDPEAAAGAAGISTYLDANYPSNIPSLPTIPAIPTGEILAAVLLVGAVIAAVRLVER